MLQNEFPFNLAYDILQSTEEIQNIFIPGILQAIETLTPREQKILHMRYYEKHTLEECGKVYGVGKERIRQIQAKALRKMRHPSRKNMYMGTSIAELKNAEENFQKLSHEYELLIEAFEAYKNCINKQNETGVFFPFTQTAITLNTAISELGLNKRIQNALTNSGIKELKDIIDMTEDELMRIPGFGRIMANEIKNFLSMYGLRLRDKSQSYHELVERAQELIKKAREIISESDKSLKDFIDEVLKEAGIGGESSL